MAAKADCEQGGHAVVVLPVCLNPLAELARCNQVTQNMQPERACSELQSELLHLLLLTKPSKHAAYQACTATYEKNPSSAAADPHGWFCTSHVKRSAHRKAHQAPAATCARHASPAAPAARERFCRRTRSWQAFAPPRCHLRWEAVGQGIKAGNLTCRSLVTVQGSNCSQDQISKRRCPASVQRVAVMPQDACKARPPSVYSKSLALLPPVMPRARAASSCASFSPNTASRRDRGVEASSPTVPMPSSDMTCADTGLETFISLCSHAQGSFMRSCQYT